MNGIPDAVVEAALNEWQTEHDPRRLPHRAAAFLAGFAAAEGPWREHLATQIEAERDEVATGTGSNSIARTGGRLWGLNHAARIVRGTNE